MMQVLLVVHLLIALALIGVVLLQRSEGGALGIGGGGGGGGMSGLMTGRGTANLLTRTTAILAAAFMGMSILLTILGQANDGPRSIVDGPVPSAVEESAPADETSGDGEPSVPVQ